MASNNKNGVLEIKFNEDRTQALATIHPPSGDGAALTAAEVIERLKGMGVTYGVREQAIRDAIHYVYDTAMTAANIVAAQGALPQTGNDAKVTYALPLDLLQKPLPKRSDGLTDWFALDPAKLVKAGTELASIVPAQPGVPGKTLTWPIQVIPAQAGKPAALRAGQSIRLANEGTRMVAEADGYVWLHTETLKLQPLRLLTDNVINAEHTFPDGAVLMQCAQHSALRAGGTLAVRGVAQGCYFRVDGDVFLQYAEECEIVATGNVYVTKSLKNCEINTRQQVIALESAIISGGKICASAGVAAVELGSSDFASTEIQVGVDRISEIRSREIEEEIAAAEANIARIRQTLKPFASLAVHTTLPDDKRALLQKLQQQQRTQEAHINALHNERRTLAIAAKEKIAGSVSVSGTVHPGVWINIQKAAFQVESPLTAVRFVDVAGGKAVQAEALQRAA